MPRYQVRKFNQEHGQDGRFTGPGTSHQPTGNPRGRPKTTGAPTPLWKPLARGVVTAGTEALFAHGGAVAGGALGAALSGPFAPVGAVIGSAGGRYAASILGSLVGDYVGTKVGNSLLGIKERMDGHAAGEGGDLKIAVATGLGGWAAYGGAIGASRLLPGGSAVRQLFNPTNLSLSGEFAQHGAGAVGDIAGSVASHSLSDKIGHHAAESGARYAGEYAARRAQQREKDKKSSVKKAGGDGSFSSLVDSGALPHLFGPRAWSNISGTPFGSYVQSKVKEYAAKMDDAAFQHGIDLKPAPKAVVSRVHDLMDERDQANTAATQGAQAKEMDFQHREREAGIKILDEKAKAERAKAQVKAKVKKAFSIIPGRGARPGASDLVLRDAQQTGGLANVKFLQMMQETERRNRIAQATRTFNQPRYENLQTRPSEDELNYRRRVNGLMLQSVRNEDKVRRNLFGAGRQTAYTVAKRQKGGDPVSPPSTEEGDSFTFTAELAKGLNTEDSLAKGLVYGWASIIEKDGEVVTDHQGDRVMPDDLVAAAHDFVQNSRQGGVLHDEFGHNIGHIVESVVFTKELQDHLGIDLKKVGWLIGYQITDPKLKPLVKAGVLKSFSIGGRGKRIPVEEAA